MVKCYIKDYPRPQLVRKNWINLNGQWDFSFDDEKKGYPEKWYETFPEKYQEITVPFTYETKLSGIADESIHPCVWYHRTLSVDKASLKNKRLILHFEGSDFLTRVWINGKCAGDHRGGYARFSFDITDLTINGENSITVAAEDYPDIQQPRGKQRWMNDNFDCWYVQTTGIWKTVWAEIVPEIRLDELKITPIFENNEFRFELNAKAPKDCFGPELTAEIEVSYDGTPASVVSGSFLSDRLVLTADMNLTGKDDTGFIWDMKTWSPEEPYLYDLDIRIRCKGEVVDEVGSYCAMREIRIDGPNVLLNGRPLYQRLILDQGYWKDSHLTPPDEEALVTDIERIQSFGYNGVRKHQKIEDERFLFWSDVKGLLLWSEAPAAYRYTDAAVQEFTAEWMEIVKQNYNHPCIITWTPFNESWGVSMIKTKKTEQHFTEAIYHLTKSFDPYRPVITNDGWEHTVSDIITLHDYEEEGKTLKERYAEFKEEIFASKLYHNGFKSAFADGFSGDDKPVIISEYGGIAFDNGEAGWGYGNKVSDAKEFAKRFDAVTTAIKELPYVCGYCYTQVSDVQQEVNGLMDMERNCKVDPEVISEINLRPVKSI